MKKIVLVISLLSLLSFQSYAVEDPVRDAYLRSFQYESKQNYDDAIRTLIPIYNKYPKAYTLNLRIAWLHYLSGHYANSIKHYETAATTTPSALEPQLGKLLPLLAQERYEEAEQTANKVIRTDTNNYYANLRLIIATRMQNKYAAAQNATRKMRALYPSDIHFIAQDALIHEQLKDFNTASALYWDLLILDPENITAKRYFGME